MRRGQHPPPLPPPTPTGTVYQDMCYVAKSLLSEIQQIQLLQAYYSHTAIQRVQYTARTPHLYIYTPSTFYIPLHPYPSSSATVLLALSGTAVEPATSRALYAVARRSREQSSWRIEPPLGMCKLFSVCPNAALATAKPAAAHAARTHGPPHGDDRVSNALASRPCLRGLGLG